jgi:SAM-dependent methyltransferase
MNRQELPNPYLELSDFLSSIASSPHRDRRLFPYFFVNPKDYPWTDYWTHNPTAIDQTISTILNFQSLSPDTQRPKNSEDFPFDLSGCRILDIGCGTYYEGYYYPFLASICGALGADAYGIDLGTQNANSRGYYQHIQTDVLTIFSDLLPLQLTPNSLDLIACLTLFTRHPSKALTNSITNNHMSFTGAKDHIYSLSTSLLRTGGIFCIDEGISTRYFKKINTHELVEVEPMFSY